MKKHFFLGLIIGCLLLANTALATESTLMPLGDAAAKEEGGNYVLYPVLASESEHAESINAAIVEKAQIDAYKNVLLHGAGSAGLQVDWEGEVQGDVLSLVISAKGKMPVGRPSQVYYPMTYDVTDGEEIPFDTLFQDPDGAKACIESVMENEIEEMLSTHLENRSLFPVPFERYTIDSFGNLTIWYEIDQLSFLSGYSGAVTFRFSQLEAYYDLSENSIINRMRSKDTKVGYLNGLGDRNCIGMQLENALDAYRSTVDSEYYPGGACYEVEDAKMRGTLLLTDESEEKVLGLLCRNLDDNGIITGKTGLNEAVQMLGDDGIALSIDEDTAQQYRVCAGESITWQTEITLPDETRANAEYTLYADESGTVQYIRLMIKQ